MTTTYVNVPSLDDFAQRMDIMKEQAEPFFQVAVFEALNGREVRTEILHERTPMSSTRRYGKSYDKDGNEIKKKKSPTQMKASGHVKTLRNSFRLELKGDDEVIIGHTAPYAGYVHDAKKPLPGDYWEPGKKGGWTTKGTGPKFVSAVLEEQADAIPERVVKQLDKMMQQAGIF